jgi:thiamine-phosphate pyrophosphorylase
MAAHAPTRVTRARRAELLHGIYVVLNDVPQLAEPAARVLDAGVRIVQYRAKRGARPEALRALRELTRARDALLIVNDDWRAAVEFDCDGVHLGPQDEGFATVASVRRAINGRLIGLSCGTEHEVAAANLSDVDYLGIGPVFATSSKPDAGAPLLIAGLRRLAGLAQPPVAAIGGIDAANLAEVCRCGVAMAAVISAVASAAQPGRAAAELIGVWNAASP